MAHQQQQQSINLQALRAPIAERGCTHVAKVDLPATAAVHESTAVRRVELRGSDHFGQLLHVLGLDIYNVEGAVPDRAIPHVYPQIVGREEHLSVRAHGDGIDVVPAPNAAPPFLEPFATGRMRVAETPAWRSFRHSGKPKNTAQRLWLRHHICHAATRPHPHIHTHACALEYCRRLKAVITDSQGVSFGICQRHTRANPTTPSLHCLQRQTTIQTRLCSCFPFGAATIAL